MIQNYLADSLVKNYTAPSYPIFISLQNTLNAVSSKKSLKDSKADIADLVSIVGFEAEKFVLSQLFDALELPDCKQKPNCSYKVQLLIELIKEYSTNVSFLSYFPEVIAKLHKEHKLPTFFGKMLTVLKIPLYSQIGIALSLYLSDRSDFSQLGQEQLTKKLVQLKKNNKVHEIPQKIIEELLFQISRNPQLSERLEEVYNYLLQSCENLNKASQARIYNYFKGDWQFFANQVPIIEKPPTFSVKKVNYLRDLGPSATHHVETLKTLFTEIGNLNQEDIFQCLMMMAEEKGRYQTGIDKFVTDMIYVNKKNIKKEDMKKVFGNQITNKKSYANWNIDNFLTYCTQHSQNFKWQNVLNNFDRSKLVFSSEEHFYNLMKIIEKIKKIGQKWKMPETLYFKKWMHPASQASFLVQVFKCKEPECLQIHEVANKRIQKSVKDEINLQKQIWGYIDLVQLLFEVSQYRFMEIRQLFDYSMAKYPELLLLTLSEIKPNKGQVLLDQIFSQLLPTYLHNHSTNIKLLQCLWQTNQDLVISCICQIYKAQIKKDNTFNLSRVLDITQSIKDSLLPFTTWNDYQFSIPLAVIAGKRQFLNFEPWLNDRIDKLGNSFVRAILLYIDNNLIKQLKKLTVQTHKENILEKAQLNIQLLNKIFFTIMMKVKRDDMSPRNFEYLKRLFKECCAYFPEIADGNIPDEIEKETEREMNRIYKEEITIKEAVERMKKLKNSKKQQDQEQLASHLTFLCSELTYHHSYPQKQLNITADLFSGIINANLIEKKVYLMFLHVLQTDLQEDNQKYPFAIRVMEKIKGKLCQESWFCENLLNIDLIMKKNPEFVQEIIRSMDPPKALSMEKEKKLKEAIKLKNNPPPEPATIITVLPSALAQEEDDPSAEITLQPSTVLPPALKKIEPNDYDILTSLDKTKQLELPDKESKVGKINIVCNTLSLNNIDEKAKQLEKVLDCPQAYKLLAYNMLFKRISMSQNNGAQIFSRLMERLPNIQKPVINLTYKILQKWFALTGKSINDKKFNNFKNIGSWLGRMTIGRGVPVPIHKLHLKNILISTFAKSNGRLSMNISVVLKILEFINLHPEIFRSTSPWLSRLIGTISEIEDKIKDDQTTKAEIKAFFKSISIKVDSIPMPPTSYLNSNRIIISELDRYIVVDEDLAKYYSNMNIDLKMIITRAVDDSIQEIVEPVIDRAVKIAKVTTKQLILKDFALEPSPEKFRESSYNVVKNMAGPLAHVTCRQPLKASMNRSLKNLLSQHISDQTEIDTIIQKAIPDNLDFGCTLIKQAVIQSAEDSIKKDSTINEGINSREKCLSNNEDFKDEDHLRDIPSIVPEQLRPKIGGLTVDQFFVYQQFKNERQYNSQKVEQISTIEKIFELINQRGPGKSIRDLLITDNTIKEQFFSKFHTALTKQNLDENELNYYFQVCQHLVGITDPKQCWKGFKQIADLKKKQIHAIINRLVKEKYFPDSSLSEIDETNEEENRIIMLFEEWLDTAHEKIQPFLRTLEDMFNCSENQIKAFFSCSLYYAMQKVQESFINSTIFDTNYIEDYSKLIIISYKTIALNNCNLYLEHTLKAILQVFDKLQNENNELSFQRPFFKLFTNLIGDVTRKEYDIDQEKIMTFYYVLGKELEKIAPTHYPGFSFAWVELISNRNLMPALLKSDFYWDLYFRLLKALLKFLRDYITQENLADKENGEIYQTFYKGVFKLLIVIIHDFSDFLSAYSLQLCLVPGPRFIQITNMIISAYPRQMKFQFPLKIDSQEELEEQVKRGGEPRYCTFTFDKKKYEEFLKGDPRDEAFRQKLSSEEDESLQFFMLYIGWTKQNTLSREQSRRKIKEFLVQTKDKLKNRLITYFVNLIRYPNSVTLLFIEISLDIIFSSKNEAETRDMLLTNIMVRMGAQSPQAWGLDYLVRQLIIQKSSLITLNVPKQILKLL